MTDVLIVNPRASARRLIRRWLEVDRIPSVEAGSAVEALLIASEKPPKVAFWDSAALRRQKDAWLAGELQRLYPETVVLFTGPGRDSHAMAALPVRAHACLVTPLTAGQLSKALRSGLREHRARVSANGKVPPADRIRDAARAAARMGALNAVLAATHGQAAVRHARRVALAAAAIARTLGMADAECSDVQKAALLRDVQPVRVSPEAPNIPFLAAAEEISMAAGERFDGTGVPMKLKGAEIPLGARILAVADAYERTAAGHGEGRLRPAQSLDVLRATRASEFDPSVIDALDRFTRELSHDLVV